MKKMESCVAMKCEGSGGGGKTSTWSKVFVDVMRESQPYFRAHRGGIFVVVVSAEVIQGPNLDAILECLYVLCDSSGS
ncbi:hypothetical protein E3N88_02479 [Mikania micrantha]|uniref:Uncharacterized protein n=1 Tax=Mikania micrantha TaxID=192012 RepID=A0A5N6Q4D7_9ASTR|nr:hypothetical protein E3N88_02479 [Mikania micrantha]